MLTIERMLNWAKDNQGDNVADFPFIQMRRSFLLQSLFLEENTIPTTFSKNPAKWNKQNIRAIYRKIREAGFADYQELIEKYGREAIHSIIEHNFLHYRPVPPYCLDIESRFFIKISTLKFINYYKRSS